MADRRGGRGLSRPSRHVGAARRPRSFSLAQPVDDALEKARDDLQASRSSIVEEALIAWLAAKGYTVGTTPPQEEEGE